MDTLGLKVELGQLFKFNLVGYSWKSINQISDNGKFILNLKCIWGSRRNNFAEYKLNENTINH